MKFIPSLPIVILDRIDSSNNYAMAAARAGTAVHGQAFFALEQTNGKGQRGKTWTAEPGKNIMVSLVFDPSSLSDLAQNPLGVNETKSVDQQANHLNPIVLNWIVALAAAQLLEKYAVENVSIKWPNDIYWRDRKAAGILIENNFEGTTWKHAIIGMGMNINQTSFGETATRAVSLKQISGRDHDPLSLTRIWITLLDQWLKLFFRFGTDFIHQGIEKNLFGIEQVYTFQSGTRVFSGTVLGVSKAGNLRIKHTEEEDFAHGTIEWILPSIA